jgi:hypothetical protein
MREFFRGWRRKVGCVTLAMACVFAAGWVRCHYASDVIEFTVAETLHSFMSGKSGIVWYSQDGSIDRSGDEPLYIMLGTAAEWGIARRSGDWMFAGFDCRVRKHDGWWTLPFWSIVIPFTLISAWCLLTKPRAKHATKSEPADA